MNLRSVCHSALTLLFPLVPLAAAQAAPAPGALPTGGQVVSGQASLAQTGNTLNINQTSQQVGLNWQTFNIGSDSTVNFVQPSASSLAVNRILGNSGSEIFGHLNANGQVWLINPNGVLFGQGAQVNVGGLVASTLDTTDNTRFSGTSQASVINNGQINGGYVAFLGQTVSNAGSIHTPGGTTALGAGSDITLNFANQSLLGLTVNQNLLDALAQNGGLIEANGGAVLLSAGARDSILKSQVNNTGIIEAQTVGTKDGHIALLGGMTAGTANVGGTLDASAPNGGNGGFIETSAANVHVADDANITTKALAGTTGLWLIDPQDFTIAASGGDITGAVLGSNLNSNSITILSSGGATAGNGDIFVNDGVSWSANTGLTLTAARNITVNSGIDGSGTGSSLVLNAATANGADAAVPGGYIQINSGIAAGSVSLTGGSLTLNSGVTANALQLNSTAAITQTAGVITANTLTGSSVGDTTLNGINQVGELDAFSAQNLTLVDGANLVVVGPISTTGGIGNISFTTTSGNLAINATVDSGAGTTTLTSGGSIALQSPLSFTGGLVLNASGAITDTSALSVGQFTLNSGNWSQVGATLPTFSATSFTLSGGTFVRALGGNGTSGTPYQITDVYGLQGVGTLLSDSFTLANNIDASSTSGWNSGAGFVPLGNGTTHFSGTFDGLGHSIKNLTINQSNASYVGLFGYSSGQIRNVGLDGGNIQGAATVGLAGGTGAAGGAGSADDGSNNATAGAMGTTGGAGVAGGSLVIGALVGQNDGTVANSYSSASVVGAGGNGGAGGMGGQGGVGGSTSTSGDTGATGGAGGVGGMGGNGGNVTVGGLVGINTGSLTNSYATGNVSGAGGNGGTSGIGGSGGAGGNSVAGGTNGDGGAGGVGGTGGSGGSVQSGGLVGSNSSATLSNSYAAGNVTGVAGSAGLGGVGGMAGASGTGGTGGTAGNVGVGGTSNVSGSSYVGGVAGNNAGTISTSYWDTATSGQSLGIGAGTNSGATGESTANMMMSSTFSGWDITNVSGGGHVWRIYDGYTMPLLEAFLTPVTATLGNATVTYNAADQSAAGVTWSPSAPVSNIFGSFASGSAVNAGSYTLSGTGVYSDQQGYDINVSGSGAVTITPAPLTLSAVTDAKVYDGTTSSVGVVTTSGLQGSDSVTGLSQSFDSKDVLGANGSTLSVNAGYTVNDGNGGNNYIVALSTANGTITPATLTITPTAGQTKVYGTSDLSTGLTYSSSVLYSGDAITGNLGRAAGENIGSYAYNLGNLSAGSNYTVVMTASPSTFAITPATITITPTASQTKVYGASDPTSGFAYGQTGLVSGVTPTYWDSTGTLVADGSAINDSLSGNLGRAAGENVGSYAYNLGGVVVSDPSNYNTLALNAATFAITPATITITPTASQTKVYGASDPTSGFAYGQTGLVSGVTPTYWDSTGTLVADGSAINDSLSGNLGRAAGENVGSYAYNLGGVVVSDPSNYNTLALNAATFTITPAALTITPDAGQTKVYGQNDSSTPFTYTSSGYISGVTPTYWDSTGTLVADGAAINDTSSLLTGNLGRANGENVNTYAYNVGSLSAGSNYTPTITTVSPATFAITPASITITPDAGQSKVYGTNDPSTPFAYTQSGLIATGTHQVTYWNSAGVLANDGTINSSLSGNLGRAAGENVGTYAYNLGSLSAGGNYTLAMAGAPATFAITPATLTIAPTPGQWKVYGMADPRLAYTQAGVVNGVTPTYWSSAGTLVNDTTINDSLIGNLERVPGEWVGGYAYSLAGFTLSAPTNYALSPMAASDEFAILPAAWLTAAQYAGLMSAPQGSGTNSQPCAQGQGCLPSLLPLDLTIENDGLNTSL